VNGTEGTFSVSEDSYMHLVLLFNTYYFIAYVICGEADSSAVLVNGLITMAFSW